MNLKYQIVAATYKLQNTNDTMTTFNQNYLELGWSLVLLTRKNTLSKFHQKKKVFQVLRHLEFVVFFFN